jgi:tight adherence protein B
MALVLAAARKPKSPVQLEALVGEADKAGTKERATVLDAIRKDEAGRGIPFVNRILNRLDLTPQLHTLISRADLKWTPASLVMASIAAGLLAYKVVDKAGGPFSAASYVAGLAVALLPVLFVVRKGRVRLETIQKLLPDALDMVAGSLRAGYSLSGALGVASRETPDPLGRELRVCCEEQNFGLSLRGSLENLTGRVPSPDLRMVATAVLTHKDSGGNLAEMLEKTSTIIRGRSRLLKQVRIHTAQGRASGLILSLLPPGVGTMMNLINPDYMKALVSDPLGRKLLIAAGAMNLIGLLIIRKIVAIKP